MNNTKSITLDKKEQERLDYLNFFDIEDLKVSAKEYAKAVTEGRLFAIDKGNPKTITSKIKLLSFTNGREIRFNEMMLVIGLKEAKNEGHYFTVTSGGLNRVVHAHSIVLSFLNKRGFITKSEYIELSSKSPIIL